MDKYYLQSALLTFNEGKSQWYGWKKDYIGNERMTYQNLILNDNTAVMPTEAEVNAKIQELKDAETDKTTKKASAKSKLLALGLTEEEIKLTFGL
jgi:hypothetical protein